MPKTRFRQSEVQQYSCTSCSNGGVPFKKIGGHLAKPL